MRLNEEADTLREAKKTVYFVTQNRSKFLEAFAIAELFGIRLKQLPLPKQEIQSNSLIEIASVAAIYASKLRGIPVVAEDAGFFVSALGDFPGPYSSHVLRTLGTQGILKLMRGVKDRNAYFLSAVAYGEPGRHPICFTGKVRGNVSKKPRGSKGFGFDPIFIPSNVGDRTFAQMRIEEKNSISHRAKAFAKFARWFFSKENSGRLQSAT